MDGTTIVQVVTIIIGGIVTVVTLVSRAELIALRVEVKILKEQIAGLNLLIKTQNEVIAKLVRANEELVAKSPDANAGLNSKLS